MVTGKMLAQSQRTFLQIASGDSARLELRKAKNALERDLSVSNPTVLNRSPVPTSLGGGPDGEALWFLSPVDPATKQMMRKQDGTPFWQRNVLYYLVVPNNHDSVFGISCTGGTGAGPGYDDVCPHKVLIRKVIDGGTVTDPSDESTEEALLPDVSTYLTRPDGFSVASMAEPGLGETHLVAKDLLTFSSVLAPPPSNRSTELAVDLRAVAIADARREIDLGSRPLNQSPYTRQAPLSIFLRN